MTLPPASRLAPFLAATLLLLVACRGTFEPDVTGPVTPPPPPAVVPNLPFRVGAFGPDFATGVAIDGFNSAIVVGYFQGSVDFDPGSTAVVRNAIGPADGAVAKYRDDGSLAWATNFGGTGADLPSDLALTADGGVVVTGTITSGTLCSGRPVTIVGARDAFVMKFSATGSCIWAIAIGGRERCRRGTRRPRRAQRRHPRHRRIRRYGRLRPECGRGVAHLARRHGCLRRALLE
ncbi:MAG: hypothetical protein IPJ11_03200 [Gemmatimonadetes bacterium]|nr:hypothetical protein [Gemmatimonadota bacterium]